MEKTEVLTIEEIDARVNENGARLEAIAGELETKTAQLGSARGWKLPVTLINNAIGKLEQERRELVAEQSFLTQERQNILQATAQQAAEAAAAEYKTLLEQLNPRAVEIINGLCTLQTQLLELEKIQELIQDNAAVAGKLADPIPYDRTIIIQVDAIEGNVYGALSRIQTYNALAIENNGIQIPDVFAEREKTSSRFSRGGLAVESGPTETRSKPNGLMEAARRAARLPV